MKGRFFSMDYCKTFGDYSIIFINTTKNTRNGFKHICNWTMFLNNIPIHRGVNNAYYINRTWESYAYRTVMRGAVSDLQQTIKDNFKEEYKKANNLKRIGTKSKKAIEVFIGNNKEIEALINIYNQL